MGKEIDLRDFNINKATPEREAQVQDMVSRFNSTLDSEGQVGAKINVTKVDNFTGNPSEIEFEVPPELVVGKGDYVPRALNIVRNLSAAFGLAPDQQPEFAPNPFEQETSSGAVTVHLQQKYKGIPIFQANQIVRFDPDGKPVGTGCNIVTFERDLTPTSKLSVEEAVVSASEHIAQSQEGDENATDAFGQPLERTPIDLTNFQPKVLARFTNSPEQPTVLEAGPFGSEIKASLLWFPLHDEQRLAWDVIHTMPNSEGQFRTIVDATTGEILYSRSTS